MSALMTAVRFACRGYFGQIINSGRFAVMFEALSILSVVMGKCLRFKAIRSIYQNILTKNNQNPLIPVMNVLPIKC